MEVKLSNDGILNVK